ncbi:MAG: hypothetical protein JO257_06755 [Deltaproteobacteria bacterium]|nr:hypothetical protein [Deltaproteobacteria bacterium]
MKRALLILAMLAPAAAHADDEIAKGTVIKIEAGEVYVSIGRDKGVEAGSALRIKRAIALHHPVTKAAVDDWIPVASASVTEPGAVMSRAVIGDEAAQIQVGDIAEIYIDRPDAPPPTPEQQHVDPQTAEVLGIFASQVGKSLDERIAAWERYLSMRPGSPFAPGIRHELDELHSLREQLNPPKTPREAAIVHVDHASAPTAAQGEPLALVFVLDHPERVASAYLHYRPRGAKSYRSVLLVREHDIYLRGTVPADIVAPPGLDYFVEVSRPDGRQGVALGTARDPIAVTVEEPPLLDKLAPLPMRSGVRLAFDYLDFGNLDSRSGDRTDRLIHATTDFTYRLPGHVESVGVGYGVYAGQGGYANETWTPDNPMPRSGFHYGYADVEVGDRTPDGVHYSAGGQLIAGVGRNGFGMGVEGRVRVGEREGTNLALIGRTIDSVGWLSEVRFGTRPLQQMLLGVSVGATNQPNDGDVGVKLGTEVELLASDNASILLRGSWQGRTIDHGGLGAGAGLGFRW